MLTTLTHRQLEPEFMDDPSLDPAAHRVALGGLSRINAVSRAGAQLWKPVRAAVRTAGRPMRLLDVACGGGDVTLDLHRRAQRADLPVAIHGCDLSATALDHARERARARDAPVTFEQRDVLASGLPEGFDIITCGLFLHHLTRDAAVELLREMGRRADVVIVSDLRRSMVGLIAAKLGVPVLTRSPVVHVDAPQSVRAAFTRPELAGMAHEAGLADARVKRGFAFRMLLTWSRR